MNHLDLGGVLTLLSLSGDTESCKVEVMSYQIIVMVRLFLRMYD